MTWLSGFGYAVSELRRRIARSDSYAIPASEQRSSTGWREMENRLRRVFHDDGGRVIMALCLKSTSSPPVLVRQGLD
jgi:hypothetical protein